MFISETPLIIRPSSAKFDLPIKGFGYSFSSNVKDMTGDQAPNFAIGAVSSEGEPVALLLRSRPTIAIKSMSIASITVDGKSTVIEANQKGNNPCTVCMRFNIIYLSLIHI